MATHKYLMNLLSARILGPSALLLALGGCQGVVEQGSDPQGSEDRESAGEGSVGEAAQQLSLQARRHRIAGGNTHALTIRQNGTVWSWGSNSNGQIGDGGLTTTTRLSPVQVSSLSAVVSVAAGDLHSLAVRADGSVWAWGYNGQGELGDGTKTQRTVPVQVSGLTGIVTVAAGFRSSLALKSDGTVWAWGYNFNGQLGNGTSGATDSTTPVQVHTGLGIALTNIVAISAGYGFATALRSDGTVWTWGVNGSGQLGIGAVAQQTYAVQVVGLTGVSAISAGNSHVVALQSNGAVYTWGDDTYGQIGNGAGPGVNMPQLVAGLANVKSVTAGYRHTLVLKADGTAAAWGYNGHGELGVGDVAAHPSPVTLTALAGAEELAGSLNATYAILSTGGVIKAWGYDNNGELGNGAFGASITPTNVSALSGLTDLAIGDAHTVALRWDGTVWAWGENAENQIGDGTTLQRLTPVQVRTSTAPTYLTSVIGVAGGAHHTLALRSDGTVWTWGDNDDGQIGDGTITAGTDNRSLSTQVKTGPATFLSGVVALAAGDHHSLALRYDGTVYGWGSDDSGQLGLANGLRQDHPYATQVANLGDVIAIAGGGSHSIAVGSNGAVYTWGAGASGQLCDGVSGSGHDTDVVSQVPGVTTATRTGVAAAAGAVHTLLLMSDGKIFACGGSSYGQIGDNTNSPRSSAVQVLNLSNAVRVVAGGRHSMAIAADGSVWAWGRNVDGELGDGTLVNRNLPTQIAFPGVIGSPLATSLAAGLAHSATVRPDGLIWTWGLNSDGQLGDGTLAPKTSPIQSTFTP